MNNQLLQSVFGALNSKCGYNLGFQAENPRLRKADLDFRSGRLAPRPVPTSCCPGHCGLCREGAAATPVSQSLGGSTPTPAPVARSRADTGPVPTTGKEVLPRESSEIRGKRTGRRRAE